MVIPIHDENPTRRRAYVTTGLILVNLAIYFGVQLPKSADAQTRFEYRWAAIPCELKTGRPVVGVPEGEEAPTACSVGVTGAPTPRPIFPHKNVWLAVLLAMFLHGSVLHVLGNMLFLWIFGNNVEDQLGAAWYLAFYLLAGLVAAAVYALGNIDSVDPFLGASGAIAGVMGAYIVWFPRARILSLVPLFLFLPMRLPAVLVLGLWFVLQLFTPESSGVATLAHVGGFVFGMLVGLALRRASGLPRPLRRSPPAPTAW